MLSFFKGIFTCSWRTKKEKSKVIPIDNNIKESNRYPFDIKKNHISITQANLREIVSDLNHHIKNVKCTSEPFHRYIIPTRWLRVKLEALNSENFIISKEGITNSIYINEIKKRNRSKSPSKSRKKKFTVRTDINQSDICLTLREIMKLIINNFEVDYVIKVPFTDKINLSNACIMSSKEFLLHDKVDKTKFEKGNNVKKAVLFCEDVSYIDSDDEDCVYSTPVKKVDNVEKILKLDKRKLSVKSINEKNPKFNQEEDKGNSIADVSTNLTSNDNEIRNKDITIYKSSKAMNSLYYNINNLKGKLLDPKGIHNPSVYCFMNTCMQCLVSIPELNNYFFSGTYKKDINNSKGISGCEALYEFIQSYSSAGRKIKLPQSLYAVCHSFLQPQRQHDCQEFLRRFLTKLQDELNLKKKYTFPDKISHEKAWSIYREINPSIIDSLFTGLIRSSVYCNKCQYRSDTYDPFMDLSVPIQRKNRERLENCLENYFAKEFIDCEYKCSSCKKKTSISKQLEIVVSPPILTVHIKRFESFNNKFNGSIEFTETLDLSGFSSKEIHSSLKYELFAVAVHLGTTINSGHYIARWYYISDDTVEKENLKDVLSSNAYMLFYRRR